MPDQKPAKAGVRGAAKWSWDDPTLVMATACAAATGPALLTTTGVIILISQGIGNQGVLKTLLLFPQLVIGALQAILVGFFLTLPACLLIGLPLHYLLRRWRCRYWWIYASVGAVVGAGYGHLSFGRTWEPYLIGSALGLASALSFWWIAIRTPLYAQKQNAGLQKPGAS